MARWKALPEGLDPAVIQLAVQLRRMKDDSRLSLDQLAARTGYSASSWERYLGGRLLPPREAAEALAELVGADQVRLLVLYEAAADAWRSGPAADPSPTDGVDAAADGAAADAADPADADAAGPEPVRRPRQRLRYIVTAVVAAAAGAAIALLSVQPAQSAQTCPPAGRAAAAASPTPVHYTCAFTRRDGLWYAGNSTTTTDTLEVTMAGPEVAELQCLLQHAGISPGGIDGNYGPLTEHAVIQEQQEQHLIVDGQVGPQTWGALRR